MEFGEDVSCFRAGAAREFCVLADRYRGVSSRLMQIAQLCEEFGVERSQMLDIVFTHVVSYVDAGAEQLAMVASGLANADKSRPESAPGFEGGCDIEALDAPVRVVEEVPDALRAAAIALDTAMNRALDLAEELGDEAAVGDTHPFGHIIQGICIPYVLLAADAVEGQPAK